VLAAHFVVRLEQPSMHRESRQLRSRRRNAEETLPARQQRFALPDRAVTVEWIVCSGVTATAGTSSSRVVDWQLATSQRPLHPAIPLVFQKTRGKQHC